MVATSGQMREGSRGSALPRASSQVRRVATAGTEARARSTMIPAIRRASSFRHRRSVARRRRRRPASCGRLLVADASRQRMELADRANVLQLGLDAAATVQARNSTERMLMHQMAAAHVAAMEMQAEA